MASQKISLRAYIGSFLNEAFEEHPELFVLDADLAKSTTTADFAKEHPDHFFELGIAEQNSMSIASGIATEGGIPFFVDFAIFASGTCWTQLRMAAYSNLNVKVIGTHPGMDGGYDGATHHALEDIALTRAIPDVVVLSPSNKDELREAIKLAIETPGVVYIRCARDEVPDDPAVAKVELGKAVLEQDKGSDFALIYEGSSACAAKEAYARVTDAGLLGKLVNIFSIDPIDRELLLELAQSCKQLVTVENHQLDGGLGSAVAEVLCELPEHAPLKRVAVQNCFTESGPAPELKQKYGISAEHILSLLS